MISINESFISAVKMTDRSVVASCLLGLSNPGTGLSVGNAALSAGNAAVRPAAASLPLSGLEIREGNERPTKAPEAVVTAQAQAYALAAAGAGFRKQTTQHHTMWAFRGLEPWSDPA
ncbi:MULTISPECIES: hypothetical protein [Streptomyces]|uniref:Uncharacterized protein n=1 Tax=Streptomyces lasiicapitis TaxID=1923961 RepID=A0ABQ2LK41_9ACTN|nr:MULTISPECIES: hypothetical protein [Streptomyces]QIB43695.1 hypothetical protein G3H79_11925 [Streptomyces aureoverticillatus]GGO34110.1 hypothetical protein GCM10012286_02640 [Streptomyces lasiicapitis]